MNRTIALLTAAILGACSSARVEIHSLDSNFRTHTLAIAPVKGVGPLRQQLLRALLTRLEMGGVTGVDLQETDSILAGSAVGLETAADPRVLDEIKRATAAAAVVFLTADPSWRSIEVQVLSTTNGDSLLSATVRSRGDSFDTGDEAAVAVANVLAEVTSDRVRVKAAASEKMDEIPAP